MLGDISTAWWTFRMTLGDSESMFLIFVMTRTVIPACSCFFLGIFGMTRTVSSLHVLLLLILAEPNYLKPRGINDAEFASVCKAI